MPHGFTAIVLLRITIVLINTLLYRTPNCHNETMYNVHISTVIIQVEIQALFLTFWSWTNLIWGIKNAHAAIFNFT